MKLAQILLRSLFVLSCMAAWLSTQTVVSAAEDDPVKLAREAFLLLNEGKHAEFIARCSTEMGAAMTETQSQQLRLMLAMRLGQYEREISAESAPKGEFQSVLFTQRYSKGTAKLELILDKSGKLSGLWIRDLAGDDAAKLPAYAKPDTYTEEAITVKTGAFELPGTLTRPKTPEKCPAVVLVHGSGPHDQDETIFDNKPFRDIAAGLASHGIAVLRYEKRTHKYGAEMNPHEIGLEEETIDDALSAVALLRGRSDLDSNRIFVLGHSLGGIAAPFIVQRDPRIAGIILMAGTPRPLLDLVEEQVEYIAMLDGRLDEEESKQLAEIRKVKTRIRNGTFDAKDTLLGAPAAYWKKVDELRPGAAAAALTPKCRILVIHGGRDYQIDAKSLDAWKKALDGRSQVTFHVFDTLNHLMIAGEGKSSPAEYQKKGFVDEAVIEVIRDWILGK